MKKQVILSLLLSLTFAQGFAQAYFSLEQCIDSALHKNLTLVEKDLAIQSAKLVKKDAFTHYFPQVAGGMTYFGANNPILETSLNTGELIGDQLASILPPALLAGLPQSLPISLIQKGGIGTVSAIQPIFMGGRIINGNKLARTGVEVKQLQKELARKEITLQTSTYFWQIINLEDKRKTILVLDSMLTKLHQEVSLTLAQGLITKNDLLRVELQQQSLQSDLTKVNNGIKISKMLLAQVAGLPDTNFELNPLAIEETPSQVNIETAIQFRLETQLLDKQIYATQLKRKIELGGLLPSLNVGIGYLFHDLIQEPTHRALVFGTLTLPISQWWGGSYKLKQHRVETHIAQINKENSQQLMHIETQKAWDDLQESQTQIMLAQKAITSAQENLRINRNTYLNGMSSISDLIEAQQLYLQAHNRLTDAQSAGQVLALKYKQLTESNQN